MCKQRVAIIGLLSVILGASGVVVAKASWNAYRTRQLQWEQRVERFPGEALRAEEVRRYATAGKPGPATANSFGPWEFAMPKTAVPGNNLAFSCTFRHAIWPGMDGLNLYFLGPDGLAVWAFNGLVHFDFFGQVDAINHPGEYGISCTATVAGGLPGAVGDTVWTAVPADASGITWAELAVSVEFAAPSLYATSGSNIIGAKTNATHAKEKTLTEAWQVATGDAFNITVGSQSGSDVVPGGQTVTLDVSISSSLIDADDWSDYMIGTKYAMSIEDIKFGLVDIDTSSFAETTGVFGTGASNGALWVEGFGGNSIGFWCSQSFYNGPDTYNNYTGGAIQAPFSYDFSQYAFKWMDDTNIDTSLQVYVTGLRNLNASGIDIGDWHGTVAALQALGRVTQQHGCYYWDSWEPDMQAACEMYLDLTSAESLGIDIRGPRPQYSVDGAGFAQVLPDPSPVDGLYWRIGDYLDDPLYGNANGFRLHRYDADAWGIGPGPPAEPYYLSDDNSPDTTYYANPSYSAAAMGNAPVVTETTSEQITVDSDCATPSHAHDATCIWDGPPLDATDHSSDPRFTDVLSLTADTSKSIYGDAHDHTDWVNSNGTTPDADGYFTVNAGGATLTLTLKCNYRDRQALVGGVGQIAAPDCYRNRRHDAALGEGDPPETAEAVWDWRGRYLRQSFVLPSVPVDATVTITYYMDLLGVGDNHKTDSTRQSEYTYSAGDLYTLTRTIPASYTETIGGEEWSALLVDLYDEQNAGQPVAMAVTLAWQFSEAGAYRLSAPVLLADNGDRQEVTAAAPYYREAPADTGMTLKVGESPGYAQGQVSGHYNGLANMALFMPDDMKGCVVERCFPTLDVLIGAQTGIDQTSNVALSGWAGWVTNSGEAWTLTHNAAAESAHMTDGVPSTLKTLQCLDLAPGMALSGASDTIAIPVAVRCYRYTCVNGLPYTFYGAKYVGGRGHGMAVTAAAAAGPGEPFPRKRGGTTGNLYRRPLGSADDADYALVAAGTAAGEHAHWETAAQSPLGTDEARTLQEYALQQQGGYDSMGRLATREYALLQAVISAIAHPFLREGCASRLYLVCTSGGAVHLCHLPYGMTWDDATTPYTATGYAEWPCLAYHRPYLAGALLHGTTAQAMRVWRSDNNEWQDSADLSALNYSYPYADYGPNRGYLYIAGYSGGTHKLAAVDALSGAVQWQKDIAAGDDAPGALGINAARRQLVYAVPDGADLKLYWSDDDGDTWTLGGTATGLAYPSLDCSSEFRFYLAGYAGGQGYCERWDYAPAFAIRGSRVTVGASAADRVCVTRLRQLSQPVIVMLQGGSLVAYRTTDDGATWTLAETVLA